MGHIDLYWAIRETLYVLPRYFESELNITGVIATDLFTFNSSLGASIETRVVETLNALRQRWDPDSRYTDFQFERRAQRFPDVVLRNSVPGAQPEIIMGIELKGWYALSKEGEPSYRYKVTPAVCAPADLLVVYPWSLSNVVSGSPKLLRPYVIGAYTAAEYRNYFWQYVRDARTSRDIELSSVTDHYPTKSQKIADVPKGDKSNFGRFARVRIMDEYRSELFREQLLGIPLSAWQKFLSIFSEEQTVEGMMRRLDTIAISEAPAEEPVPEDTVREISKHIVEIVTLVRQEE
jgi:hypothetical protein